MYTSLESYLSYISIHVYFIHLIYFLHLTMIDNQYHNDKTLFNDLANLNFEHASPYMSMNELNILKYNLHTLSVLLLNGKVGEVKNFDNLKLLLKCGIISICETWFNEFNMNIFELQGYINIHTIRNHTKKAGGVSIYIKSTFSKK